MAEEEPAAAVVAEGEGAAAAPGEDGAAEAQEAEAPAGGDAEGGCEEDGGAAAGETGEDATADPVVNPEAEGGDSGAAAGGGEAPAGEEGAGDSGDGEGAGANSPEDGGEAGAATEAAEAADPDAVAEEAAEGVAPEAGDDAGAAPAEAEGETVEGAEGGAAADGAGGEGGEGDADASPGESGEARVGAESPVEGEGSAGGGGSRSGGRSSPGAGDDDDEDRDGGGGGGEGRNMSGGEDDDDEYYGDVGDDQEEEEEEDPVDETANRMQELQEKYDQLLELNERALQQNVALQRRVIQRRAQDKSYDAPEKQSEGKVTEHKYQNVLHNVHTVRLQLRLQQVKAARMSEELKNQLETKRQKAIDCRDSFQEFKRQVARHAEYARTGKKIQEKIISEVEEFELDKDAEVEEVRGSNISLKNRLAKLEQALRKKDELAENLHVIDFEQLKIENQTLNEKIEERNEELHKLRKKTVTTVQIITHMREKVQFVQQEYQALKSELTQLDQDLAAQRDLVAKTKHERDEHRADSGKLRQQTSIMNSEGLTRDFEARNEHIKQLKDDIARLKKQHMQMTSFVKSHGGTI